eukprot:gene8660-9541_t
MSKSSASLAALIKSRSALISSGGGPPAFVREAEAVPPSPSSSTPAPAVISPPLTPTAASTSGKEASAKATPPVKYTPKVAAFSAAPKCLICEKTVYKMEEIVALGEHWHDKCFTCGGKNKDGCGKILKRDGYVDHGGMPYCTPCYNKLFRPKGYFGNTLNTDYGPSPLEVRDEPVVAKVASPVAAVSPSSGPPAPFAKPAPPAVASRPAGPAPAPAPAPPLTPPGPAGHAPAAARTASPPPAPKHVPPPPPKHAPALVSLETIINRSETTTAPPPPPPAPPAPPAPQAPPVKATAPAVAPAPPAAKPAPPAAPVVPAPPVAPVVPAAPVAPVVPAPKYTPTNDATVHSNVAPKCTICGKTVYKVEEVVAVGRIWHDKCFTCGGNNSDGCGKVLSRHGYVDHANQPYCNACHKRNFGPKGFGYSNTLNSTGIVASDLANVSIGETKPSPPPVLPAATSSKPVTIGASTRAVKDSNLYKEASYVGSNDEVDESEW